MDYVNNPYIIIMSNNLICKHCKSKKINKMGIQNNKQRYKCRECKKTFTNGEDSRKKYTEEFKLEAIRWYLENAGIRSIERRMNVSDTTIIRWIKNFGKTIKERIINDANNIPDNIKKEDIEILEGDEIVTYIKKKSKMAEEKSGYGFLLTETGIKLLIYK